MEEPTLPALEAGLLPELICSELEELALLPDEFPKLPDDSPSEPTFFKLFILALLGK